MKFFALTISIFTIAGVCFLCGAGVDAARAETAACKISFTSPAQNAEVGSSGAVTGTADGLGKGHHLWLLAHPKRLAKEWWPQGGDETTVEDQKWDVLVYYGSKDDINKLFEVVAVVVDDGVNKELTDWFERSKATNDYRPIRFPRIVKECESPRLVVKKTSH
ncbi:MAG: hypothetical protein E6J91_53100 [Deltaproteobacteria bacterium]|nr:MAG: hypothetical protein E6J91_53100 [Deltaproteobacteria bacterium]